MTRRVTIQTVQQHRGHKFADKPITRLSGHPKAKPVRSANTKHGNETRAIREERSAKLAELYELEMLGRELGLISGGMVGRKTVS